jgi:hypothetical protein
VGIFEVYGKKIFMIFVQFRIENFGTILEIKMVVFGRKTNTIFEEFLYNFYGERCLFSGEKSDSFQEKNLLVFCRKKNHLFFRKKVPVI